MEKINNIEISNNSLENPNNCLDIFKTLNWPIFNAYLSEVISPIDDKPRKKFVPKNKGWEKLTEYDSEFKRYTKSNGYALTTGFKLADGNYLLALDIDDKDDKEGVLNGIDKWNDLREENPKEYIRYHSEKREPTIKKTPLAVTGNRGLHILFKITKEQYKSDISKSIVDLKINNKKYSIDTRCKNGCIIIEPTNYKSVSGSQKEYKWVNPIENIEDIQMLPEWVANLILKHHNPNYDEYKKIKEEGKAEINFDFPKIKITEANKKIIDLIPLKYFDDLEKWRQMLTIFKSCGLPFDEFVRLSATSSKFKGSRDCYNWWVKCKTARLNIGVIHSIVKKETPEIYFNSILHYNSKPDNSSEKVFTAEQIDQRYLLDQNDDLNASDFSTKINNFFESDIKSLNIKSPYDTGKTFLLRKIIKKFDPKRILWLSYRKTLTNDILGSFAENAGFEDYQDGNFDAPRLICQLESILRIKPTYTEDGEKQTPRYDLIIIDEIESILAQFNSPTFKQNSKECFEYVHRIIGHSNKLITLDGDLGNRGFNYISSFGKYLNIENVAKINLRKFKITDNTEKYKEKIAADIADGRKIVIVSLSSNQCEHYREYVKSLDESLNVLVYTGSSDDTVKEDLKNVLESWSLADVLIYSPTIEAGVSFDLEYFDRIYGIICARSTTQRAFLQMLSRVRKVKNNIIIVLNEQLKYNIIPTEQFYNFTEVKLMLETLDEVRTTSPYDVNYIYNRLEGLNASSYNFLAYLEKLIKNKGHSIEIQLKDPEEKPKPKDKEELDVKISWAETILNIEDVTIDEYKELISKQKQSKATATDKQRLLKHSYKLKLGVDSLTEEILKSYQDKSKIDNFAALISDKNIPTNKDNQTKERIKKVHLLNSIIEQLGFSNVFDNKKVIIKETFDENIKQIIEKNPFFKDYSTTKILFNLDKNKSAVGTTKGFLGFINTILSNYCLEIQYKQVRQKGAKLSAYILNQTDFINEILEYKIRKGFKLKDPTFIRHSATTTNFKNLVNLEKQPEIIEPEFIDYSLDPLDFGIQIKL